MAGRVVGPFADPGRQCSGAGQGSVKTTRAPALRPPSSRDLSPEWVESRYLFVEVGLEAPALRPLATWSLGRQHSSTHIHRGRSFVAASSC